MSKSRVAQHQDFVLLQRPFQGQMGQQSHGSVSSELLSSVAERHTKLLARLVWGRLGRVVVDTHDIRDRTIEPYACISNVLSSTGRDGTSMSSAVRVYTNQLALTATLGSFA